MKRFEWPLVRNALFQSSPLTDHRTSPISSENIHTARDGGLPPGASHAKNPRGIVRVQNIFQIGCINRSARDVEGLSAHSSDVYSMLCFMSVRKTTGSYGAESHPRMNYEHLFFNAWSM